MVDGKSTRMTQDDDDDSSVRSLPRPGRLSKATIITIGAFLLFSIVVVSVIMWAIFSGTDRQQTKDTFQDVLQLYTQAPTTLPNKIPTLSPRTSSPTAPTSPTTRTPTSRPTRTPNSRPTRSPTSMPTRRYTHLTPTTESPSRSPTNVPAPIILVPTSRPTRKPTPSPTVTPLFPTTQPPTPSPTKRPISTEPTDSPSENPTRVQTLPPTLKPTPSPTGSPSESPVITSAPTIALASDTTTTFPVITTVSPTSRNPTLSPTRNPTAVPNPNPTLSPTRRPTLPPTRRPTSPPNPNPTRRPSPNPTPPPPPTSFPTVVLQTRLPTTPSPTRRPTARPTFQILVPTPSPVQCTSPVQTSKSCFAIGEAVQVDFENCAPLIDDFLGIYPSNANAEALELPPLWLWACGDQNCRRLAESGSLRFDGSSEGAYSWPLAPGTYKVFLTRSNNYGGYYRAFGESREIAVSNSC